MAPPSSQFTPLLLAAGFGAFVIVWRRRRRRDEPALAAATTSSAAPELAPTAGPARDAAQDPFVAGAVADVLPGEASIPRWRRPSLKEARFRRVEAHPNMPGEKLTFQSPPDPGVERSVVRYDLVSLLASPDDGTAATVAGLMSGDEVDVISRRDGWVQAQTPSGAVGWIAGSVVEAVGRRRRGVPPTRGGLAVAGAEDGTTLDAPPAGATSAGPEAGARPKASTRSRKSSGQTTPPSAARPSRATSRARLA